MPTPVYGATVLALAGMSGDTPRGQAAPDIVRFLKAIAQRVAPGTLNL